MSTFPTPWHPPWGEGCQAPHLQPTRTYLRSPRRRTPATRRGRESHPPEHCQTRPPQVVVVCGQEEGDGADVSKQMRTMAALAALPCGKRSLVSDTRSSTNLNAWKKLGGALTSSLGSPDPGRTNLFPWRWKQNHWLRVKAFDGGCLPCESEPFTWTTEVRILAWETHTRPYQPQKYKNRPRRKTSGKKKVLEQRSPRDESASMTDRSPLSRGPVVKPCLHWVQPRCPSLLKCAPVRHGTNRARPPRRWPNERNSP